MNAFGGGAAPLQDAGLEFGVGESLRQYPAHFSFNSNEGSGDSRDHGETLALLLRLGVSAADIENCRWLSKKNGSTLSRELIAGNLLDEERYYREVASNLSIGFAEVIDPNSLVVLPGHTLSTLRKAGVIKALAPGGESFLICAPDDDQLTALVKSLRRSPTLRDTIKLTTPILLDQALIERQAVDSLRQAVFGLRNKTPAFSASQVATGVQGLVGGVLIALLPLFAWLYPSLSLLLCHVISSIGFAGCVHIRIRAATRFSPAQKGEGLEPPNGPYPIYTVMVALYRETTVVPQLVSHLMALNWPASRLEIMIVCESSDEPTIELLRRTVDPSRIQIIVAPKLGPQTKPRALSFALQAARGEFVVIYDAEDRPHPDQLMEAYERFQREPLRTACLQAPLVITNPSDGFLARMFALEYAALFGGLLPYLASTSGFLPLGGTSNHFRRSILRDVGAWDCYNVTEDADLGTRLRRLGFTCGMITKPTFEDAPVRLKQWLPQRVRWFKGWLQTWLVHMRQPGRLWHEFGTIDFFRFQLLTMGMFLSALVYPSMILVVLWDIWAITTGSIEVMSPLQMTLFVIDICNVILGHLVFSALGEKVERARGVRPSALLALRLPIYWTLLSIAAAGAFWELARRPFHWNKTEHFPTKVPASQ
jgi:cellulose synthase/poly-beta-1,6-N-acetylglucosamine synthase-like glycosyltransferase